MSFLEKFFGQKEKQEQQPLASYQTFWDWFKQNEKTFHDAIKNDRDVEGVFFEKLSAQLNKLRAGYYFLAGMLDPDTVELIFTAEGAIENIAFVEDLVAAAPAINGWRFTALKSPGNIDTTSIKMEHYTFDKNNIHFYSNENPDLPDEIDISIVHDEFNESNRNIVANGVYIFLDNFLGELNLATTIDNIAFVEKANATEELVPIEKLKDFLIWRQKEFIEKYDTVSHNAEDDNYSVLEATLSSGNKLLAVINRGILTWNSKASHPWVATVEIKFNGSNNNGMPDRETADMLNDIEDEILKDLKSADGYINIGRQTAESVREIFFVCKEFRLPSRVLDKIQRDFAGRYEIRYSIYKDKYWQSFKQFS